MYENGDDDKVNLYKEKNRASSLINKAKTMVAEHRKEISKDTKRLIKQEIKAVSSLNSKFKFGKNMDSGNISAETEELKRANDRLEAYITE
ncbi:hypothetical protein JCM13267_02380 [Howardella ureilytica]